MKVKVYDVATLNKSNFDFNNNYSSILYLDTSSITRNEISDFKEYASNSNEIPSRAKRAVEKDTIIISTVRPNLEHYGFLEMPANNTVVSTGFVTVHADKTKVVPKYLYYLLTSPKAVAYLTAIANTAVSSYPSFNPDDLGNYELDILDSIEEQKKIVQVLSSLDSKISLNRSIISDLESLSRQIYDYWFVQFDFPDEHGRPYKSSGGKMVWNEKLKRHIPEGWEVVDIRSVCDIIDCLHSKKPDYNYECENCYLLTLENLTKEGRINLSEKFYISRHDYKVWTSRIEVQEGDFVVTNAGRAGDIGRIPKGIKCAIGRNLTAIRPKSINSFYLNMFLHSFYVRSQILKNLDQGSFFMSFNVHAIKELKVLVPSERMMTKAIECFTGIIERIESLITENLSLTTLRDFLLPMLMNGQVTVK